MSVQCRNDDSNRIRQVNDASVQKIIIEFPNKSQPRRKIYNDAEFKEVVQNFYELISEINKCTNSLNPLEFKENKKGSKRIQKKTTNRGPEPKIAVHQRFKKPKTNPIQNEEKSKTIIDEKKQRSEFYRFKNHDNDFLSSKPQQQKLGQDPSFLMKQNMPNLINQYGNQIMFQPVTTPFVFEPQVNIKVAQKNQKRGQFGRNAYHVAIAYHIYMANVSQNKQPNDINSIEAHYDPTKFAKQMKDIKKSPQDNKKHEDDQEMVLILRNDGEERQPQDNEADFVINQIGSFKKNQDNEKNLFSHDSNNQMEEEEPLIASEQHESQKEHLDIV